VREQPLAIAGILDRAETLVAQLGVEAARRELVFWLATELQIHALPGLDFGPPRSRGGP